MVTARGVRWAATDDPQPRTLADDGQVAAEIRAVHRGPMPAEQVHRPGGGVAVVVVATDAGEGDPGVDRGQEGRVLVVRAVVWHLEHVRSERGPARQQSGLGRRLHVTGEQDRQPAHLDPCDHRAVVRVRAGPAPGRRRSQDAPPQRPGAAFLPGHRAHQRDPGAAEGLLEVAELLGRLVQGTGLHFRDNATAQHTLQAGRVVGVQVGDQEQRDLSDAEVAQTAVDRAWVGPGVHDDPAAGARRQHERVALPDVFPARSSGVGTEPVPLIASGVLRRSPACVEVLR